MDRRGQRLAVQLHADLERLLRGKVVWLSGMTLTVYRQLVKDAVDLHKGNPVLAEALARAEDASGADPDDPLSSRIEVQEALVVVGQLMALPHVDADSSASD